MTEFYRCLKILNYEELKPRTSQKINAGVTNDIDHEFLTTYKILIQLIN